MSIYKYPYIGLFTNNTKDIRGLEFFEILENDETKLYVYNNNNKILKNDYANLFINGFRFILKIYSILDNDDIYNPIFQKWIFDFFSNFIDFREFEFENLFIKYEDNYEFIIELIKKIDTDNKLYELIKMKKKKKMFLLFIYKIWNFLSNLIKKNFDFYFDEKNYIKGIDQMFNSLKKLEKFDDNLPNSFDKDKSMDRILKINDHLNKKYALYFKLLRNLNNNEINLTINIDKVFDEIQKKKK